jgi:hypothetical protein
MITRRTTAMSGGANSLQVKVVPAVINASAGDVSYVTSDSGVVTVTSGTVVTSNSGFTLYNLTLVPHGAGLADITATVSGASAVCGIEVLTSNSRTFVTDTAGFLAMTGTGQYMLANDIDFAEIAAYTTNRFGNILWSLDGHGYAVKNLKIDLSGTEAGFITMMDGTSNFTSVSFIGMVISGSCIHGGFIQKMDGSSYMQNCFFDVTMETRGIRMGVIGQKFGGGSISNCVFKINFGNTSTLAGAYNANPRAAIARYYNGTISSNLIDRTALGAAYGKVYAFGTGDAGGESLSAGFKTQTELQTAATFDATWTAWVTGDGIYPRLRTAWDA